CRPDQQQARIGMPRAHDLERIDELRDALARVQVPETAEQGPPVDLCRADVTRWPRRMRNAPDRPVVAAPACTFFDVVRVHDQAGRGYQHLTGERELVRL